MQAAKVLIAQSCGFIAIIALSWIDEIVGLRSLILGNNPYISDFRESALEMLFVLVVWLLVAGTTERLLKRVSKLERYVHVCAWCHRVGQNKEWMSFEQFVERKFDTHTTHGMCEDCLARKRAELAELAARQPS